MLFQQYAYFLALETLSSDPPEMSLHSQGDCHQQRECSTCTPVWALSFLTCEGQEHSDHKGDTSFVSPLLHSAGLCPVYLFSNRSDRLSYYCCFCSFRNLSMLSDLQAHASASLWTFIPSEQWASWGEWPRCNTMAPLQKGPRISLALEDYCEDAIWANICKTDKRTKCWLLHLSML